MRSTKIHINALIGLAMYCLLIAGMLALAGGMIWVLAVSTIDTNGHGDIMVLVVGAMLPMIGGALREVASVVKRFTYMPDDAEGPDAPDA